MLLLPVPLLSLLLLHTNPTETLHLRLFNPTTFSVPVSSSSSSSDNLSAPPSLGLQNREHKRPVTSFEGFRPQTARKTYDDV